MPENNNDIAEKQPKISNIPEPIISLKQDYESEEEENKEKPIDEIEYPTEESTLHHLIFKIAAQRSPSRFQQLETSRRRNKAK